MLTYCYYQFRVHNLDLTQPNDKRKWVSKCDLKDVTKKVIAYYHKNSIGLKKNSDNAMTPSWSLAPTDQHTSFSLDSVNVGVVEIFMNQFPTKDKAQNSARCNAAPLTFIPPFVTIHLILEIPSKYVDTSHPIPFTAVRKIYDHNGEPFSDPGKRTYIQALVGLSSVYDKSSKTKHTLPSTDIVKDQIIPFLMPNDANEPKRLKEYQEKATAILQDCPSQRKTRHINTMHALAIQEKSLSYFTTLITSKIKDCTKQMQHQPPEKSTQLVMHCLLYINDFLKADQAQLALNNKQPIAKYLTQPLADGLHQIRMDYLKLLTCYHSKVQDKNKKLEVFMQAKASTLFSINLGIKSTLSFWACDKKDFKTLDNLIAECQADKKSFSFVSLE